MQSTMNLLEAALSTQPAPYWTDKLKLSRSALHTAKTRGHLSPAIAGALAEELGQDVKTWAISSRYQSRSSKPIRHLLGDCRQRKIRACFAALGTRRAASVARER